MNCILCNKEPATTTEHPLKARILKHVSPETENPKILILGNSVKEYKNPKKAKQKTKDLCATCNNTTSQPMDLAFDDFIINFENYYTDTLTEEDLLETTDFSDWYSKIYQKIKDSYPDHLTNEKDHMKMEADIIAETVEQGSKKPLIPNKVNPEKILKIKQFLTKALICKLNRDNLSIPSFFNDFFFTGVLPEGYISCISLQKILITNLPKGFIGNISLMNDPKSNSFFFRFCFKSYVIEFAIIKKELLNPTRDHSLYLL